MLGLRPDSRRQSGRFLMAKRGKNGAPAPGSVVHLHVGEPGNAREADEDEVADLDALEEGQLSRAIDEIRAVEGAKAEVYRMSPPEKEGHCRVYPVSLFSIERVAADYGPGKYRVRFKGVGDKYIKGGSSFMVAEGLHAATPTAAPTGIQDFLALIKAEREKEAADREKAKGQWWDIAKLVIPLVAPKILDMLGGGKAMSPADIVGMMRDLRELQGPQQDLSKQFEQVASVLQGARDIIGEDGGGKSQTGSTWVDLIRDLAGSPAAGALVQALSGAALQPSPLPLPSPTVATPVQVPVNVAPQPNAGNLKSVPAPAAGCSSPKPSPSPDMFQQLQWLRATLGQLLVQAAKGANPRLYAEVMLDNLPPYIDPSGLFERLAKESWWGELQAVDARVAQYEDWFARFRDYVVRALKRRARKLAESAGEGGGLGPETTAPSPAPNLPGPNEVMPEESQQFE